MQGNFNILWGYMLRLWPGITLGILLLAALGRSLPALRIIVYIGLFIVIRDVMTPVGLWRLGPEGGLWIRFTPDSLVLALLGLGSLAMVAAMCLYDPEAGSLLIWFKGNRLHGLAAGMFAALVIALPLLIIYRFVPLEARGGPVAVRLLPGILTTTLLGNLYEEVLFRGFLQGLFEKKLDGPNWKPAVASGLAFGFGHSFLALAVTNTGWPLLAFATWEGIIAGLLRSRFGVISATLAHGLAIFLLAGGF